MVKGFKLSFGKTILRNFKEKYCYITKLCYAKIHLNKIWNLGTTDFEVTVNNNTKIICIPLSTNGALIKREVPLVYLGDVAYSNGFIKIQGY